MKDYIVTHTFKSEEARNQHFAAISSMTPEKMAASLKNDRASFQINWGNKDAMVTYCWWKANSPDDILNTLGDLANLYNNDIKEMTEVHNLSD